MTTTLTPLEAELLEALDEVLPFAERFVEKAGPEQIEKVADAQALAARVRSSTVRGKQWP